MRSLLTRRNGSVAYRANTTRPRLFLEQLDRRQMLSADPWAGDLVGPATISSSAPGAAEAVARTGIMLTQATNSMRRGLLDVVGLTCPNRNAIDRWSKLDTPTLAIDVSQTGSVKAVLTVTAPRAGRLPISWGTPKRIGNVVTMEIHVAPERGSNSVGAQVITRHRHEIHVGTFQDGTYRLQATVGGRAVLSREFVVGKQRGATILPVVAPKPQAPTAGAVVNTSLVPKLPVMPRPDTLSVETLVKNLVANVPFAEAQHQLERWRTEIHVKDKALPTIKVPAAAAARGFKVGMTVDAANKTGVLFRPAWIDGKPQGLFMDFRLDRLNVAVTGGVITRVVSIG